MFRAETKTILTLECDVCRRYLGDWILRGDSKWSAIDVIGGVSIIDGEFKYHAPDVTYETTPDLGTYLCDVCFCNITKNKDVVERVLTSKGEEVCG